MMTKPKKQSDEDRFAAQLEQLDDEIRSNADRDTGSDGQGESKIDVKKDEPMDHARKVLGLIQRVRKSKETAEDDTVVQQVTPAQESETREKIDGFEDPSIQDKIGRFQIRRQLGQGGYGLVFLAFDPQLDRDVALKVPRPEVVMNASLKSRFVREAKAAGSLNHANIVTVFEAGNVGPICYIASAYCRGPSLGQWVLDQDQSVSPMVAAGWLSSLADAVQHAHSRGIVHRDLKPDNILIEIEPESKDRDEIGQTAAASLLRITDFGLAKDLDKSSDLTNSGSVVGTPSYISPEQTDSRFGPPGPVLDIYGLGAILYFVLCKIPPITGSSLLETIKKVQEQTPVPPRKIRPDVPRDLEAICLKCLEKQARHRYQTASELQSDLLRFRNGLPVQARRPSLMDRTLMWCRRRPAVSALAASLVMVLAASSIALGFLLARSNSLKQLSDANAAAATVERDRSREALQAMTSGVASNWLGSQRELTTEQKTFLENTIAYYREFAAGSTDDPEDQFWVAQAEHRLAQLLSRLGQFDEAIASFDRAIILLEQIPSEWEPAAVLLELADTLHGKDGSLSLMGNTGDALPVAQRAVEIVRELVSADPDNMPARVLLSQTTDNLGSRFQQLRQFDESLALLTESVVTSERLLLDQPDNRSIKRSLGIACMNLGNLLARMRKMKESRQRLEQSLKLRTELATAEPDSAIFQFDLAFVLDNLAAAAHRVGEANEAVKFSEQATKIDRKLVEQYPMEERYRRHLIGSLNNLSGTYNGIREFEKSKAALSEANSITERCIRDFPKVPRYRLQLAIGQSKLGTALAEQGQHKEAIESHDQAVSQLREMISQSIEVSMATSVLENALTNRATALGYVGRHDDAIADWDAAIKITRADEVNTVWLCRATSLAKKGDIDTALSEVERVLAETMQLPKEKRRFTDFYNSACVLSLVSTRVEDEVKSREHALRAIELIQKAIDAGLSQLEYVRNDPELKPLHSYPGFQELIAK